MQEPGRCAEDCGKGQSAPRTQNSQVIEWQKLRNASQYYEYRNGKIDHATISTRQRCIYMCQWQCATTAAAMYSQNVGEVHGGLTGEVWEPQFGDSVQEFSRAGKTGLRRTGSGDDRWRNREMS